MASTLGIKEVTLATISTLTTDVNAVASFGKRENAAGVETANGAVKAAREDVYSPMVVRVTNHPADVYTGTAPYDKVESMALFLSQRHGEPWVMKGHQPDHIVHRGAAPIADTQAYSVIYVNYDYTDFT